MSLSCLFCLFLGVALAAPLQTFGKGRSQVTIRSDREFELLSYAVSPSASSAAVTFFWITGDPIGSGPASGVDVALWRFYLDGESVASVGPMPSAQAALIGNADPSAPWNNDFFGKNSEFGGWHFNLLVPFTRSVRVTLQMPPSFPTQRAFAMARGVENMPLSLGALSLPPAARLRAVLHTSVELPVLAFHDLVQLPGDGAVLGVMIDISSADGGSLNSLEGCWHAYDYPGNSSEARPHTQHADGDVHTATSAGSGRSGFPAGYPGLVLGTGAEDYPESAYYFNAGPYRGPTSGLTVMRPGSKAAGQPSRVSFYKLHHRDPLVFAAGLRMQWRNGDVTDVATGEKCTSLTGSLIGSPGISNVSTLVYAYTW